LELFAISHVSCYDKVCLLSVIGIVIYSVYLRVFSGIPFRIAVAVAFETRDSAVLKIRLNGPLNGLTWV